jgi:hypothetical protein
MNNKAEVNLVVSTLNDIIHNNGRSHPSSIKNQLHGCLGLIFFMEGQDRNLCIDLYNRAVSHTGGYCIGN